MSAPYADRCTCLHAHLNHAPKQHNGQTLWICVMCPCMHTETSAATEDDGTGTAPGTAGPTAAATVPAPSTDPLDRAACGSDIVYLTDAKRIRDEAVEHAFAQGAAHAAAQISDAIGPIDLEPLEHIGETEGVEL